MKVIPIVPRGFCPGVVRAIKIVESIVADPEYPRPIQVLGMIVHNRKVVEDLANKGVITLDDPGLTRLELVDRIHSGTVVITAHGADQAVFQKIRDKGLRLVDATCADVYKTHDIVKRQLSAGMKVIYIGKKGHPETEAILAIDRDILLIEELDDINHLPEFNEPLFVTNQTTFSIIDLETIFSRLREKYPNIIIQDEICNSTRIRQEAIINSNKDVDLCYIVGDPRSNNTRSLVLISENVTHTKTILIQDYHEINPSDLENVRIVSVSSGASTPTLTTRKVIEYLENYDNRQELEPKSEK